MKQMVFFIHFISRHFYTFKKTYEYEYDWMPFIFFQLLIHLAWLIHSSYRMR